MCGKSYVDWNPGLRKGCSRGEEPLTSMFVHKKSLNTDRHRINIPIAMFKKAEKT